MRIPTPALMKKQIANAVARCISQFRIPKTPDVYSGAMRCAQVALKTNEVGALQTLRLSYVAVGEQATTVVSVESTVVQVMQRSAGPGPNSIVLMEQPPQSVNDV